MKLLLLALVAYGASAQQAGTRDASPPSLIVNEDGVQTAYTLTLDLQAQLGSGGMRSALVPGVLDLTEGGLLLFADWLATAESAEALPVAAEPAAPRAIQSMRWHRLVLTVSDGADEVCVAAYIDGKPSVAAVAPAAEARSRLALSRHLTMFGASAGLVFRLRRFELQPHWLDAAAVVRANRVGWAFSWGEALQAVTLSKQESKRLQL